MKGFKIKREFYDKDKYSRNYSFKGIQTIKEFTIVKKMYTYIIKVFLFLRQQLTQSNQTTYYYCFLFFYFIK